MSSSPMRNIHVSTHPCVKAKLSKLRSSSTASRETRLLVNEIASLIAAEALGDTLEVEDVGEVLLSNPSLDDRWSRWRTAELVRTPLRSERSTQSWAYARASCSCRCYVPAWGWWTVHQPRPLLP